MNNVIDINRLPLHAAWLGRLANKVGKAGIFGDGKGGQSYEDEDITVLEVMKIHEFGSPEQNIPQRSVVRAIADAKRNEAIRIIEKELEKSNMLTDDPEDVLEAVSKEMSKKMKKYVKDQSTPPPPNRPATIRIKGFNNPLYWTGKLAESFEEKVEEE